MTVQFMKEADRSQAKEISIDEGTSPQLQLKQELTGADIQHQRQSLTPAKPIQFSRGDNTAAVHQAAHEGISGSATSLPHLAAIQNSFGKHDVTSVNAFVGGSAEKANAKMGSEAYATGNSVAFKGSPSLHTAAHEAAHVVQQRAGVSLKGGVGQVGDKYEQHADAVADAVVQGKSAEGILDQMSGGRSGDANVQNKVIQHYKGFNAAGAKDSSQNIHWASPSGDPLRVTEDGTAAVEQPSMYGSDKLYVEASRLPTINATLLSNKVPLKFVTDGATVKGAPPTDLNQAQKTLTLVKPVQVADPSQAATIPDDCGRAAHTVTGANASKKTLKATYNDASGAEANVTASHPEIMKLQIMADHFAKQVPNAHQLAVEAEQELYKSLRLSNQIGRDNFTKLSDLAKDRKDALARVKATQSGTDQAAKAAAIADYKKADQAFQTFLKQVEPKTGKTLYELFVAHSTAIKEKEARIKAIMAPYDSMSDKDREAFDQKAGINRYANPEVGQAYTVSSGGAPLSDMTWNYHWGGVILKSLTGSDNVTMEGYAGSVGEIYHQVYGVPTSGDARTGQTFHEQTRDDHRQHGDAPTTMATEKQ